MTIFYRNTVRILVIGMCCLGLPTPAAQAALVATDHVEVQQQSGAAARERLGSLFDRADVRAELERYGVSPDEARSRVNAMSDDEAARLATRFDSLPAGGSGFETVLVIGFLVFITLLITDILGFTKVFSFTRPAK
jgi:hypothetical protein